MSLRTADGATKGQRLSAYRFISTTKPIPRANTTTFTREKTGTVEIVEIVDEHYARARVLSGDVHEGNMVELEP